MTIIVISLHSMNVVFYNVYTMCGIQVISTYIVTMLCDSEIFEYKTKINLIGIWKIQLFDKMIRMNVNRILSYIVIRALR